jgi:hypothetical protein
MTGVFSPTRHGIPLLAIAMVSFAGWSIAAKHDPRVAASPPIAAPTNPYDDNVAGTGIVEPASEVIALAIERGGVVSRIDVKAATGSRRASRSSRSTTATTAPPLPRTRLQLPRRRHRRPPSTRV